jgi:tyrosinase
VSPATQPTARQAPRALRHRRNARELTDGQLRDLRRAITEAQGIRDDRGYQYWAGIHGLPLPESCTHHTNLFLPWHRAYLYLFEKELQDRVPGVTLPWWDWTRHHDEGIPDSYRRRRTAEGRVNSLYDSPIQRSGRETPRQTRTSRRPGRPGWLPDPRDVDRVLDNSDFFNFSTQLESIHDGVHIWVGGTMSAITTAAYDPVFWAHHCMIDRLWYLWQLRHSGASLPANLRGRPLRPFAMTVADTLDITQLGYDYAAATAAAPGGGGGG